ncbi:MAG: family 20 glycosylhydrolase [Isosphaeraceae bacterium]
MRTMRTIRAGGRVILLLLAGLCLPVQGQDRPGDPPSYANPSTGVSKANHSNAWRCLHMMAPSRDQLIWLTQAIEKKLAPWGVNVLIFEVNYNFAFPSHPELRAGGNGALQIEDVHKLKAVCQKHGIRLIPLFNCLGHQSWSHRTFPLLIKHPEFDETPELPQDNKGIYCRSWCPLHPGVNAFVFALIDDLIDAFGADALHVGMDEVFLVANAGCPRCKGKDPAELFARAVNDLHQHLVEKRKLTMLMWADRLLDDAKFGYGKWESSRNGTAGAIDRIPKDIILCDWHYETRRQGYPSIAYFQQKGFRVLPSTWRNKEAALAVLAEARKGATDRLIGHVCTCWVSAPSFCRAVLDYNPTEVVKPRRGDSRDIAVVLKACMDELGDASTSKSEITKDK